MWAPDPPKELCSWVALIWYWWDPKLLPVLSVLSFLSSIVETTPVTPPHESGFNQVSVRHWPTRDLEPCVWAGSSLAVNTCAFSPPVSSTVSKSVSFASKLIKVLHFPN